MTTTTHTEDKTEDKTDNIKRFVVIMHNDEDHTFDYVVYLIQKTFGYTIERCVIMTQHIHTDGLCVVWSGPKEVGELKCDMIASAVPDTNDGKPINYPMRATLELAR